MLLQFVQIAKIANPPVADELFQRSCGKSFNIHTGLFTEMGEFLDEFGCTMIVLTVQLPRSAACGFYRKWFPTARALSRQRIGSALRHIFSNLRDNHISLIDLYRISNSEFILFKVVQIMQIRTADFCSVNHHRLKNSCNAYHTGSCGSKFNAQKLGIV